MVKIKMPITYGVSIAPLPDIARDELATEGFTLSDDQWENLCASFDHCLRCEIGMNDERPTNAREESKLNNSLRKQRAKTSDPEQLAELDQRIAHFHPLGSYRRIMMASLLDFFGDIKPHKKGHEQRKVLASVGIMHYAREQVLDTVGAGMRFKSWAAAIHENYSELVELRESVAANAPRLAALIKKDQEIAGTDILTIEESEELRALAEDQDLLAELPNRIINNYHRELGAIRKLFDPE